MTTAGNRAFLTFDDGPDPAWTPAVLDALGRWGVLATFFVVAPRARLCPPLLRRMEAEGHGIGFHCSRHVRHDRLSEAEIEADVRAGLGVLKGLGVVPSLWRTPWGMVTPASERVAAAHGLGLVGWTADTEDWRGDDAATMLGRVRPGLAPGAVVLMHDGLGPGAERTGSAETVRLLGPLVAALRVRGLEPAVLDGFGGAAPGALPDRNPGGFSGV